jgi:hypothetical protein
MAGGQLRLDVVVSGLARREGLQHGVQQSVIDLVVRPDRAVRQQLQHGLQVVGRQRAVHHLRRVQKLLAGQLAGQVQVHQ